MLLLRGGFGCPAVALVQVSGKYREDIEKSSLRPPAFGGAMMLICATATPKSEQAGREYTRF